MLRNIMGVYFIYILDGGKFWAAVLNMHMHALAPACISFWFMAHVFVCASPAAAFSGRYNGGVISRGFIRKYGLGFVPTPSPSPLDFVRGESQTISSFIVNVVFCHHFRLTTLRFDVATSSSSTRLTL